MKRILLIFMVIFGLNNIVNSQNNRLENVEMVSDSVLAIALCDSVFWKDYFNSQVSPLEIQSLSLVLSEDYLKSCGCYKKIFNLDEELITPFSPIHLLVVPDRESSRLSQNQIFIDYYYKKNKYLANSISK